MLRHPLTWGGQTGWLNPAFFGRTPIIDHDKPDSTAPDQAHTPRKTSTAMAAVKAPARESLLHWLGTRLRGTTANCPPNSPLMIAGADLVAPSPRQGAALRPSGAPRTTGSQADHAAERSTVQLCTTIRHFSANVAAHRRLRSSQVTSLVFIGVWLVIRLCLISTTAGGTRWKDTTKPPVFLFLRIPGEHSPVFASSCAARIRKRETAPNKLASHIF